MRTLVAVTFAALVPFSAASAQPAIFPGREPPVASAFGPDPVIQITTTFRARIEGVADIGDVPSPTAQDSARRTLYNMAANECTVLAEYWKAECRLNSLSVDVSLERLAGPGAERETPSMFGTAVYELRLQSPGR
ncbi:hypothetical protein [Bradyrhizobium sp. Tv2a-2]|uniref:hypothetical protein n=1 Tax=Bradyrhizobium sp. Tv2a-2 TaxID=113395 RepID=UPI00041499B7|nr:hypothetical protein [Bradyrhizobium sp. Tv2a-2]